MSDNRYNRNGGDPTGDIYFDDTLRPEHYRNNEKSTQKQKGLKRSNLPLFSDDEAIPTFNLAEDYDNDDDNGYGGYGDGYGDIYIDKRHQQQPPYEQPEKTKKKKKKHRLLKALILTPIVALLTVVIVGAVLTSALMSKVDYNQVDLAENQYVSQGELYGSKDVTNILFMGIDDDENGNSRSDSMMLISIDKKHNKIKLTSFLRDSWVDLPMKGKKAKLNAAYAANGVQGTVDTIEYNFGVDIDHYVMVDFEMFTKIIDAVGGVEVEVTEKEAKFIRNTTRYKNMQSGEKVRLGGAEALVYCRIRKLDTDYMRTYRQRKVISALMEQAKQTDIKALIDVMFEIFPLIQTDLDKGELISVGIKGGYGLLSYEIEQTRVPIQEHMKESTINGQWVEVLDMDKVRKYLYDFIYTDKLKTEDNITKEE